MFKTLADQRVFGAKLVNGLNWLFVPIIGVAAFLSGNAWLALTIAGAAIAGFAALTAIHYAHRLAAYAVLANRGRANAPFGIVEIRTKRGQVLDADFMASMSMGQLLDVQPADEAVAEHLGKIQDFLKDTVGGDGSDGLDAMNYGKQTRVWDRIFGTVDPRRETQEVGIFGS